MNCVQRKNSGINGLQWSVSYLDPVDSRRDLGVMHERQSDGVVKTKLIGIHNSLVSFFKHIFRISITIY